MVKVLGKVEQTWAQNEKLSRKEKREGDGSEVLDLEQGLYDWLVSKYEQKAKISWDIFIVKAKCFADEFYGGRGNLNFFRSCLQKF